MRLRSLAAALLAATSLVFASMAVPATAAASPPTDGGVLTPQVVGGTPAPAYSFSGSLQTLSGSHFCGASVVHPRWAVTARHCVQGRSPSSMRLRVGSNNRTSGGALVSVTSVATHPTNDLAVIGLTTVPSAYLPVVIAATSGPVGTSTRIMGWGQTCPTPGGCGAPVQLQQLNTSIVADGSCAGIVGATEICTGNPGGVAGACYGDSGGPQVKTVGGAWHLVGATSRSGGGSACAVAPSIYVDVPALRPWIQGVTGLPL
ncbi:secreted trypsin-like serine protease [Actinokineospora spheciospongiae]|uniref:Secreted trypsin-like serine protease n=1 Tax=Actinokineospora spheciospongiae TaxID=909613 RepID=W7JEC8_9PSEU|nr:serine protease [Actinokineospora spheciospongiae]EWC64329.1 secreted trypsin-like serine protease [Actinokineospora spheciospongiae]